jgi:hypothetical protein
VTCFAQPHAMKRAADRLRRPSNVLAGP